MVALKSIIDKNLRGLWESKKQTNDKFQIIMAEYMPDKLTPKKGKAKKGSVNQVEGLGIPCIDTDSLVSTLELIYKIQEAYYHEWELEFDDGPARKDCQIARQVVTSCAKKLKIDAEAFDSLHFLHVNLIWSLIEDA